MNVLDTSLLIEISRGTEVGRRISELLGGQPVVITSISYYEFLRGTREKEPEKRFLDKYPFLPLDRKSAQAGSAIFKSLKAGGTTLPDPDVLIAGICISNNAVLHTMDKDFAKIPGLKLELYS